MNQAADTTIRESSSVRDHDEGGTSGPVKRPWSKPTITPMHRIIRTDTGTNTIYLNIGEGYVYTSGSG